MVFDNADGDAYSRSSMEHNKFTGNVKENVATRVVRGAEWYKVAITTTGSAGSATGTGYLAKSVNGDKHVYGVIDTVLVDYHVSAPVTTDVTIYVNDGDGYPNQKIMEITNNNTDKAYRPRVPCHETDGSEMTGVVTEFSVCAEQIKVDVAGCDALTNAVVVYVLVR